MTGRRIAFLANLARRLSEQPETTGRDRVEWGEVATALESHQRLAEALKLSLSVITDALEYHGHIFDDTTHEGLTHAERVARAALREAGIEP